MKAQIHPKWFEDAQVTCACGNSFTMGASTPKFEVDVCYNCHPFYTGQMKYLDTAGRVDAFKTRMDKAKSKVVSKADRRKMKRQQRIERDLERPDSLSELRSDKKN
jgi:large subunit ribosomal protein L31